MRLINAFTLTIILVKTPWYAQGTLNLSKTEEIKTKTIYELVTNASST